VERTTWRQRQAAQTKQQVVAAARRLFAESGYAGTTIEAIAAEAGVAVATVYKAFGTKAAIARDLNDLIDAEAGSDSLAGQLATETDPAGLIGRAVSQLRTQHERSGDIIAAIRSAADSDAALAEVWAEGTRRYDDGLRMLVGRLKALGALRPGLTDTQAVGLASALCSTETFTVLTSRHGWTPSQWQTWTTDALRQILLEATTGGGDIRPPRPGRTQPRSKKARAQQGPKP
jgi:AcrR family transcriptional regulator